MLRRKEQESRSNDDAVAVNLNRSFMRSFPQLHW